MRGGAARGARLRGAFGLALCLLALALPACARPALEGRVVEVKDGDSLVVRRADGAEEEIRIYGIDAPEWRQPWSRRAREALERRVLGKPVRIVQRDVDGYGRIVAEVHAGDVCVACELVREGHAWVYRRYTDDPVLLALEAEAREKRAGLWALPENERVPPWEWRHGGARDARPDAATPRTAGPPRPAPGRTCGAKTYCREMASCDEARFHLEQCGLTRIDGDGDGVPCEKLCGQR